MDKENQIWAHGRANLKNLMIKKPQMRFKKKTNKKDLNFGLYLHIPFINKLLSAIVVNWLRFKSF